METQATLPLPFLEVPSLNGSLGLALCLDFVLCFVVFLVFLVAKGFQKLPLVLPNHHCSPGGHGHLPRIYELHKGAIHQAAGPGAGAHSPYQGVNTCESPGGVQNKRPATRFSSCKETNYGDAECETSDNLSLQDLVYKNKCHMFRSFNIFY